MNREIPCFFLEPTDLVDVFLRRYASGRSCAVSGRGICDARVPIERGLRDDYPVSGDLHPHDDPRWPAQCDCGYAFEESDTWQCFCPHLYRRADTGELYTLVEAPPGAMWYADWFENHKGPDGRCLVVKTPGGDWLVDAPSSSGSPWTRTGAPPKVTARPSILQRSVDGTERYHGWLRDGVLVAC